MKFTFPLRIFHLLTVAFLATAGLLTTACNKSDSAAPDYTAVDDASIKKYLADSSLTNAQKQSSGLYFIPVTTNTSAAKPVTGQIVSILYTGKLLNGTVIDASSLRNNTPLSFALGIDRVIPGLEEGLALMHKGDKATLLIPSALAYGGSSSATVPANSVIRFDITLLDINTSYAAPDDYLISKYLADNKITAARKTTSGLYFVPTSTNPTGTPAAVGKTVSVLYTGRLLDGTVFDASSLHGNAPLTFVVGATPPQTLAGFDEGVNLMRKGEKATLFIPSGLAYGAKGAGSIGPNTVLAFDVEVTDVK